MGYAVQQSSAVTPLTFLMISAADHRSGALGLSPTVTLGKNGGSLAAAAGTVTEVGNGWYSLLEATNVNTLGPLLLHAEGAGADDTDDAFVVVDYSPTSVIPTSVPSTLSTAASARDCIRTALLNINAISAGEAPTGSEMMDAFASLNNMISRWGTQRLTMYELRDQVFSLVSGQQSYTCGAGGDFDIARPEWINGVSLISNNNPAQPWERALDVLSWKQWQINVPVKNVASSLPTKVYVNGAFPLRTFRFWPIPTQANLQIRLFSPVAVTLFSDLDTPVALPDGYNDALCWNLSPRLAPMFGVPASDLAAVYEQARDSLADIKRANFNPVELLCDEALVQGTRGGQFDWRTGDEN